MNIEVSYDIFKNPFWGMDVACEQFFGGLATGAFLFSALLLLSCGDQRRKAAACGAIMAPITAALSFILLLSHLTQPQRFFYIFTHFNPSSPLMWGAWLQLVFAIISIFYALSFLKKWPLEKRKKLALAGLMPALGVGLYHGFLLMVFRGHPLWNNASIMVMTLTGFLLSGIAAVVLYLALTRNKVELQDIKTTRLILGGAAAVQLFSIFLWMTSLYFGAGEARTSLLIFLEQYCLPFYGGLIFIGLLLPLGLGEAALFKERRGKGFSLLIPGICSALLLAGAFLIRVLILAAEQ